MVAKKPNAKEMRKEEKQTKEEHARNHGKNLSNTTAKNNLLLPLYQKGFFGEVLAKRRGLRSSLRCWYVYGGRSRFSDVWNEP
jgi:hypothetical protein